MELTIKNKDIAFYNDCIPNQFPKYASQLLNLANQNAQGTRPRVVGQLSELFPEFISSAESVSLEAWEAWYSARYPDSIKDASDKIYIQIENLKDAISRIDREMIEAWVKELIIYKTYNGLYVQKAVLAHLAGRLSKSYRLANPSEEALGIDGYVGDTPYSIKPESYKTMGRLSEAIGVKMIYYTKTKTGLEIEIEE